MMIVTCVFGIYDRIDLVAAARLYISVGPFIERILNACRSHYYERNPVLTERESRLPYPYNC